jgi:hypothetical protein
MTMSEVVQPKRRVVEAYSIEEFEDKVNALSEAGYTAEGNMVIRPYTINGSEQKEIFFQMMRLKVDASPETENLADIMEVPIDKVKEGDAFGSPLVSKATHEGWVMLTFYKGTKDTPSMAVMGRKKI